MVKACADVVLMFILLCLMMLLQFCSDILFVHGCLLSFILEDDNKDDDHNGD